MTAAPIGVGSFCSGSVLFLFELALHRLPVEGYCFYSTFGFLLFRNAATTVATAATPLAIALI